MNPNQVNVQDQFLNRIRRDRIPVTIELMTGKKVGGAIACDNFSLILRETDQLIYKHAISSISVGTKLELSDTK
jgi:host factor-I protein